jgi:hypothetical protein
MAFKYRYRPRRDYSKYAYLAAGLALILALALVWVYQPQIPPMPAGTTTTTIATTTTLPPVQTGRIAVAVKDEQHKLPGGTEVHGIKLKIGNITVHAAGNESDWITVSNEIKELQLLDYTDMIAIIGQSVLDVGKYTQIRMYIVEGNITITNDFLYIYSPRDYPLKVPSKELKTAHEFSIAAGRTTVLTVDFDVENSVTKTADGYMLKPVVKVTDQQVGYSELPTNSTVV